MSHKYGVHSQEAARFPMRFPQGMRETIKVQAAKSRRSMNDEILFLLEKGWEVVYGQQIEVGE